MLSTPEKKTFKNVRLLYSHIQLHVYIYKYMRKQSTGNDDFNNERIYFS